MISETTAVKVGGLGFFAWIGAEAVSVYLGIAVALLTCLVLLPRAMRGAREALSLFRDSLRSGSLPAKPAPEPAQRKSVDPERPERDP